MTTFLLVILSQGKEINTDSYDKLKTSHLEKPNKEGFEAHYLNKSDG